MPTKRALSLPLCQRPLKRTPWSGFLSTPRLEMEEPEPGEFPGSGVPTQPATLGAPDHHQVRRYSVGCILALSSLYRN